MASGHSKCWWTRRECFAASSCLLGLTKEEVFKLGRIVNVCVLGIQSASSLVLLAEEPEVRNEEDQKSSSVNCKTAGQEFHSFPNLDVNVRTQFPATKQGISGRAYLHPVGSRASVGDPHNLERQGKQAHGEEELGEVSGPNLQELVVVDAHNLGQDAENSSSNKRRGDA